MNNKKKLLVIGANRIAMSLLNKVISDYAQVHVTDNTSDFNKAAGISTDTCVGNASYPKSTSNTKKTKQKGTKYKQNKFK